MNNETRIEDMLNQRVTDELVGLTRKWVSPQHSNVPDRIVMLPNGIEWKIEVKVHEKSPTIGQYRELLKYLKLGVNCGWVEGYSGVNSFIEQAASLNDHFFHGTKFIKRQTAIDTLLKIIN
jgi:hypothetical protein